MANTAEPSPVAITVDDIAELVRQRDNWRGIAARLEQEKRDANAERERRIRRRNRLSNIVPPLTPRTIADVVGFLEYVSDRFGGRISSDSLIAADIVRSHARPVS